MASNEKELNAYLFDQLSICERILDVLESTKDIDKVREAVEKEMRRIERKLYQDPALYKTN